MPYPVPWIGRRIATQTSVFLAGPPCDLVQVVVNTGVAAAVCTVYDGSNATTGNQLATIDCSAVNNFFYGVSLQVGLFVVTSGANPDITVVYADYGPGSPWEGYYSRYGVTPEEMFA